MAAGRSPLATALDVIERHVHPDITRSILRDLREVSGVASFVLTVRSLADEAERRYGK